MNKVILMGRLVKDAKSKCCAISKSSYAAFTLAIEDHTFLEKDGKYHVDYISCYTVGKLAEVVNKSSLKKGQMLTVFGKWRTGSYLKEGSLVYTQQLFIQELFFCGSKKEETAVKGQDAKIKVYMDNSRHSYTDIDIQKELEEIDMIYKNRKAVN